MRYGASGGLEFGAAFRVRVGRESKSRATQKRWHGTWQATAAARLRSGLAVKKNARQRGGTALLRRRERRSRIFHDATVISFEQVGGDGFPGV